ncbi:MAG: 16S rRNA (uracil(1498)-N(3))-methyltransferase [Proteobacteria bacterium]|nr:16S rRNA (uracil(1498)-N(3))-methyltransferase [Pseudomonadota bacterium]
MGMPALPSLRRFLVPSVGHEGGQLRLGAKESHHLLQVLRHGRGQELVVFDGVGHQATAVLTAVEDQIAILTITNEPRLAIPDRATHLVLCIPKGNAMVNAIRMATEGGVTDIHPVTTKRTVPRGDKNERWSRVAAAAAQQCGRSDVPRIFPLVEFEGAFTRLPSDRRIALPGAELMPRATSDVAVLVGPEGGFDDDEIGRALASGFCPMGLGQWTLRTDTAAAAAVLLA